MCEDHPALGRWRIKPTEFLHQIGVGKSVKAISLDALCRITPWDWQQLGDSRHGAVKRGIKACHLGQLWMPLSEGLHERDLAGQVIGGIGRDTAQFREQFRGDLLRFGMSHAVHYTVTHSFYRGENRLRLKPVQQKSHCRPVVGGGKAAGTSWFSSRIVDGQSCAAQTDAINLAVEQQPWHFTGFVYREPDA